MMTAIIRTHWKSWKRRLNEFGSRTRDENPFPVLGEFNQYHPGWDEERNAERHPNTGTF
jgi:hypothetical protein